MNFLVGVEPESVFLQYTGEVKGGGGGDIQSDLLMSDGPNGVRIQHAPATTTSFPSLLALAASFDTWQVAVVADAMGKEFAGKGVNVALCPGVNIARVPTCGRNFEYISGEDPVLGSQLVVPYILGIQRHKIIATVKHFALNNQETDRYSVNVVVDEKTKWELYYPVFQAAVDCGVLAVMASYNKINGDWACENEVLLTHDLRKKMGFKYFVMSDWGAVHSTAKSANSGLEQELSARPCVYFTAPELRKAVMAKEISPSRINEMAERVILAIKHAGIDVVTGEDVRRKVLLDVTSEEHRRVARNAAAAGMVLLKNENNLLPIDLAARKNTTRTGKKIFRIAVIGSVGHEEPVFGGGGSGSVVPKRSVTVLEGIRDYLCQRKNADVDVDVDVLVAYGGDRPATSSIALANEADVTIAVVGTVSSEFTDRKDLSLPPTQKRLLQKLIEGGKNLDRVVLFVVTPAAILLKPYVSSFGAVLCSFLAGQEIGAALADVIFGVVNPSGRLPVTMPNVENEVGFAPDEYPGLPEGARTTYYREKLLVGYRWYHDKAVHPLFYFGYGLSYSTFSLSKISMTFPHFTCMVANTSTRPGAVVLQLYFKFPVDRNHGQPAWQLKGFEKVFLLPGEQKPITISFRERDVSVYHPELESFAVVPGVYTLGVATTGGADPRAFLSEQSFTVSTSKL
jgi:beta-glucosidase